MSVARSSGGRSRRNRSKISTTITRSNAVAKELRLSSAHKKSFEMVLEVKPDWTDEEIVTFCEKCSFNGSIIEQGLMNAFEDLRPSEDPNLGQWSVIEKKSKKTSRKSVGESSNEERSNNLMRNKKRGVAKDQNARKQRLERPGQSRQQTASTKPVNTARTPRMKSESKATVSTVWDSSTDTLPVTTSETFPAINAECFAPDTTITASSSSSSSSKVPTYASLLKRAPEKMSRDMLQPLSTKDIKEPPLSTVTMATVPALCVEPHVDEASENSYSAAVSSGWNAVKSDTHTSVATVTSLAVASEPILSHNDDDDDDDEDITKPSYFSNEPVVLPASLNFTAHDAAPLDSTIIQFGDFGLNSADNVSATYTGIAEQAVQTDAFTQASNNASLLQQQSPVQVTALSVSSSGTSVPDLKIDNPASPSLQHKDIVASPEPTPYKHPNHQQRDATAIPASAVSTSNDKPLSQQPMASVNAPLNAPSMSENPHPNQYNNYLPVLPGNAAPYGAHVSHAFLPYNSDHGQASQHNMQTYYDLYNSQLSHSHHPPQHQQQQQQRQRQQRGPGSYGNRAGGKNTRNRERNNRGNYPPDRMSAPHDNFDTTNGKDNQFASAHSAANPADVNMKTSRNGGNGKRGQQTSRGYSHHHHHQQQQQQQQHPQHPPHHYPPSHGPAQMNPSMGYNPSPGMFSYPAPFGMQPQFYNQSPPGYVPPPHNYPRPYAYPGTSPNAAPYGNFTGNAARGAFPVQTQSYEDVSGSLHGLYQQGHHQLSQNSAPHQNAPPPETGSTPNTTDVSVTQQNSSALKQPEYEQAWQQLSPTDANVPTSGNDATNEAMVNVSGSFDRRNDFANQPQPSYTSYPPSHANFQQQNIGAQPEFSSFPGQVDVPPSGSSAYGEPDRVYASWGH